MKNTFRHFLCISVLLSCNLHAQGDVASYIVKPGDSFGKIARSTGCTPAALAKANGLKLTTVIHPGQKLKLPGKATATTATNAAPAAATTNSTHTIQAGDTLTSIARRYAVSLESLLAANPGINPKTIKPGQKILVTTAPKPVPKPAPRPMAATPPSVPQPTTPPPAETATATQPQDPPQTTDAVKSEGQPRTVMVDIEMTYGEFAAKYSTDIARLNELNGLDLGASTVLAKGSELYVPSQP